KDLALALENPDGWWRSTAARLLFQSKESTKTLRPLRDVLVSKDKDPRTKIQAAWLLAKNSTLSWDDVSSLLKDPHPRVREHGVLLAENNALSTTVKKRLEEFAADPDARMRYQVALTLGNWTVEKSPSYLAKIAVAGADDKWTRLAVASSAADQAGKIL